jgi:GMP synthase (glutamine-hydrolysing)
VNKEFGKEILRINSRQGIFKGLATKETVWFSHGDFVSALPRGFVRTASTPNCPNAGIYSKERNFHGIQFHPEVTHTAHGTQILKNFVFVICKAKKDWNVAGQGKKIIVELRKRIGSAHVVIGISGGVDSLVAATVLHKAIGNRLHAVLVDNGLLRKNEKEQVSISLRKQAFKNFHAIDARELFLGRLTGVSDPEKKRQIIGHTFIEVFEKAIRTTLKKHPIKFLAQGTIYPDRIESAEPSKHASKIKSHHNLTLPAKMGFEIVEPLRDLYKDEVRALGKSLGLPADLLWRHPFPGPGLAIRVVGEITSDRLAILREADAIYLEELRKAGEYSKIWQAFAALLPLKTVGVMGDARTYDYIISLRAVDSVDGMSADWHRIPEDLLQKISTRITSEVRGVNRVLFDITQKPPGTIEYE